MNWLHKLRAKSHEEKRRFALWIAVAVTFFIFLMWLVGSSAISTNGNDGQDASVFHPWSDLKNALSPIFETR